MNDIQKNELIEKLNKFDEHITSYLELCYENEMDQVNNGEYTYLLDSSYNCMENIDWSENIQNVLNNCVDFKESMLLDYIIENELFNMEYEQLSSPFQYGGANENEIQCMNWGGDREHQEDRSEVEQFNPSFDLTSFFDDKDKFNEFVKNEIGYSDFSDTFYNFFVGNSTHEFIFDNYDYDIIRVIVQEDAIPQLISFILTTSNNKKAV